MTPAKIKGMRLSCSNSKWERMLESGKRALLGWMGTEKNGKKGRKTSSKNPWQAREERAGLLWRSVEKWRNE
uniref:Uncharacterized protein n=1 Tax=Pristionchus pacificus TaxID=54126 RepID=A0A2A6CHV3_PRIPA|eukprot:PDM77667.1 hypothetical protein PRIPAC_34534 [Pristionchus pacificus]